MFPTFTLKYLGFCRLWNFTLVTSFFIIIQLLEKLFLVVYKHLILLVWINMRIIPVNFCTNSFNLVLHFSSNTIEFLSLNTIFPLKFMFLFNLSLTVACSQGPNQYSVVSVFLLAVSSTKAPCSLRSLVSSNQLRNISCTGIHDIVQLVRFRIATFTRTQLTLFTANSTFVFKTPSNVCNPFHNYLTRF